MKISGMEPEIGGDPMETSDEFATGDRGKPVPGRSGAPRLFIREMVMKNFKSYAGEQRVGPFHKVRVSSSLSLFDGLIFLILRYFWGAELFSGGWS